MQEVRRRVRGEGRLASDPREVTGLSREREAPPPDRSSASVERRSQAPRKTPPVVRRVREPERARRENSEVAEAV